MQPSSTSLKGVILAAGKGTRMYPFSETLPKPILPVCNRPLLSMQLDFMRSHGITEVIVVIGHLGYAIVDALGDGSAHGLKIRYVEQSETLGMAHAVGKLEQYINSPFMLLLGDIYLTTEDLGPMIQRVLGGEINACLASKIEPDPDMIRRNFAIMEEHGGRVRQVIEKPRYVESRLKGCGLYMFDQNIFDAIRRTPRTAMRDEYEITDSIQIMINDGHVVYHSPVVKDDMNLTFPNDLLRANLMELKRQQLTELVGENTTLPDGVGISNCVVGDNVTFEHPITLTNSLVLRGSHVTESVDLDHVIVHGESTVHCDRGVVS